MVSRFELFISRIVNLIRSIVVFLEKLLGINKREKRLKEIANVAMKIKDPVAEDYYLRRDKEELMILNEQGLKDVSYMPTPFDIAKYYGIKYRFKEIDGNEPSYLERKNMIIYISEKYRENSYAVRHLLAHELGHFFLHDKAVSEMNIFPHREKEEYEANAFSVFLMPQIAEGKEWEKLHPKEFNRWIYKKAVKNFKE